VILDGNYIGNSYSKASYSHLRFDSSPWPLSTGTIKPIGVGFAIAYPRQHSAGPPVNMNVAPGNANAPIVFEPPTSLFGDIEVCLITSGGPEWGGCFVWVSTDGNTYSIAPGRIYKGARQGTLTSNLALHADPDTVDTLAVDLTESAGQLLSGTPSDRDNFVTLCYCDGELVSYQTATLTAAFKYNLTSLRRGVYGTPISAHQSGSMFARFGPNDPSLFRYKYPGNLIGQTIYIKLQSFNIYSQALQSLAAVPAYMWTLNGSGTIIPDVPTFSPSLRYQSRPYFNPRTYNN